MCVLLYLYIDKDYCDRYCSEMIVVICFVLCVLYNIFEFFLDIVQYMLFDINIFKNDLFDGQLNFLKFEIESFIDFVFL